MQKITQDKIINYVLSLKSYSGGFVFQKPFNQRTFMSSAFSILTLELVQGLAKIDNESEANFFLNHQDNVTGFIIDPLLNKATEPYDDIEINYIHYQTTAFALSALDALGFHPKYEFHFLNYYRNEKRLINWFSDIDWSNPWHESNKIMFLLQFFSYDYIKNKNMNSKKYITIILRELDKYQDVETGLWGTQFKASSFNAMAGTFHLLIFYKYFKQSIKYTDKIMDSVIPLQMKDGLFHPFGGGGACEDLDAIDILYKVVPTSSSDLDDMMIRSYDGLLNSQNDDGGFCWAKRPDRPISYGVPYLNPFSRIFNMDMFKWVLKRTVFGTVFPFLRDQDLYMYSNWDQMKYNINQSDIWSTWFRLLAIATIEKKYPDLKKHDINFQFRSIPSLGWL